MTDEQVTMLARYNLFKRGLGAKRFLPQVLAAEDCQKYYSKRLGEPVTLEDTFRILARHNAMPNTVPVYTRAMMVRGQGPFSAGAWPWAEFNIEDYFGRQR